MHEYIKNTQEKINISLENIINNYNFKDKILKNTIKYSLLNGGKRIRPLLIYAFADIFQVNNQIAEILAVSIELMHSYSLIHDDIMDNDDYRRNMESCHKKFNIALAILTGDALHSMSIEILINNLQGLIPHKKQLDIINCLITASGTKGMIAGQSLDLTELSKSSIDTTILNNIHRLKTGALFDACFNMVFFASQAKEKPLILVELIKKLGILFQMQDDYIAQFPELSGKNHNSDEKNNKKTFANIYDSQILQNNMQALFFDIKKILIALNLLDSPLGNVIDFATDKFNTRFKESTYV